MKKQNGVTLISLLIYVIIMIVVISVMSIIINDFYSNSSRRYAAVDELINYNKFNTYFLKEVKRYKNKVDTFTEGDAPYILFSSGNSFSFINNKIYYNDIEICKNVKSISFRYGKKDTEEETQVDDVSVVQVSLSFEQFSRTINYKLENIY